eukprot:9077688-Pyramimonas_sp.AAC.1
MWPGSSVLGTRRTQSGLQLALGIQNVAWEWCSVSSRQSKCGSWQSEWGVPGFPRHPSGICPDPLGES